MKHLFNMFKIMRQANRINTSLLNYVPRREVRYENKINWNEPEKYKHYHFRRTGDTTAFKIENPEEVHAYFKNSKELETADEKVKKIFSLGYQRRKSILEHYHSVLVNKVKEHPLDNNSRAVIIAGLTARIRHYQNLINIKPCKYKSKRHKIHILIGKRKAHLRKLRSEDYKKFEWILEVLELQFRPGLNNQCKKLSRKESIILLAKLKAEKLKEKKLADLKQIFDEQKVPFLEKKLAKLREIKAVEEKFNFTPTVSEDDIQKCMEQLEKVKIQVAENVKIGYQRKIHPYFLEPYYENFLKEKEERGQLVREEMERIEGSKSS